MRVCIKVLQYFGLDSKWMLQSMWSVNIAAVCSHLRAATFFSLGLCGFPLCSWKHHTNQDDSKVTKHAPQTHGLCYDITKLVLSFLSPPCGNCFKNNFSCNYAHFLILHFGIESKVLYILLNKIEQIIFWLSAMCKSNKCMLDRHTGACCYYAYPYTAQLHRNPFIY